MTDCKLVYRIKSNVNARGVFSPPPQISKMEGFAKIVRFYPLTIFSKLPILDI